MRRAQGAELCAMGVCSQMLRSEGDGDGDMDDKDTFLRICLQHGIFARCDTAAQCAQRAAGEADVAVHMRVGTWQGPRGLPGREAVRRMHVRPTRGRRLSSRGPSRAADGV